MNEFLISAPPLAAGLILGALFFGGLWWTVVRGISSQVPALWFFGSTVLRMSATLLGFYFVAREDWERWLLCVTGFVVARVVIQWLIRTSAEASHAP